MEHVSLAAAFVAGLLSFLSPCVLPLVPGYICLMSGLELEDLEAGADRKSLRRHAGYESACFVFGFTLVFAALGASATAVGRLMAEHMELLARGAGATVVLFGLHVMGLLPIPWLYMERRFHFGGLAPGLTGSFLMGMAFAFGWTPCIGPILAGILALASQQHTVGQGVFLLVVYSLGLGIPFVLTGFATASFMQVFRRFKRYVVWGERAAGALLVVVGVLIFSQRLTSLIRFLPSWLARFAL